MDMAREPSTIDVDNRSLMAARSAFVFVIAVLVLRFLIEAIWLLPSPVGDSAFFLTASANYCQSGFFGTTAFPIDPSGHSRMVWHGFVSPMLFSALNPACSAPGYYVILWLVKALTAAAILWLSRKRHYSLSTMLGLAIFTLAAQSFIAFRPECFAILLVVLAELAIEAEQPLLLGAVMGSLLCTQPTVAGLHGLVLLITRPALIRKYLPIGIGYAVAVAAFLALYPFPLQDLAQGILLQARRLVGRSDGSVLSYYVLFPLLPGWSFLLVAAGTVVARRMPLIVLMLPVFWFFGPRVPPTFYNLIPSCVLLLLIASGWSSRFVANLLGSASFIVGAVGLTLLCTRDVLTIARYGDTFRSTSSEVTQWEARGAHIGTAPAFLSLTNPELHVTDPNAPQPAAGALDRDSIDLYAVNGRPISPCPLGPVAPGVSLAIGNTALFNSNSGWMVYVCRPPI